MEKTYKIKGICYDKKGQLMGHYIYLPFSKYQSVLDSFCDSWLEQYEKDPNFTLYIDLETQGLSPYYANIILVSVAWCASQSLVFVFNNFDLTKFKEVIKRIPVTNQNIKFDNLFIKHYLGLPFIIRFDTMIGAQLAYSGILRNFDLGTLTETLTESFEVEKDTRQDFIHMVPKLESGETVWVGKPHHVDLNDDHIEYAARDSMVTCYLSNLLRLRAKEEDVDRLWQYPESLLLQHFTDIELKGFNVDSGEFSKVAEGIKGNMNNLADVMQEIVTTTFDKDQIESLRPKSFSKKKAYTFNPNSPLQLHQVARLMGHNLPDTESKSLLALSAELKESDPKFSLFLQSAGEWKKQSKLYGTFIEPFLAKYYNPVTKRIHPSFKTITSNAATGRLSSSAPNVLAMPEKARGIIITDEGYTFCGADLSQYELRKAAAESGETVLLDSFIERNRLLPETKKIALKHGYIDPDSFVKDAIAGKVKDKIEEEDLETARLFADTDVHRQTARIVFDIEARNVTSEIRSICKTINYAMLYLGSAATVQETLADSKHYYTLKECQEFIDKYNNKMIHLAKYRESLIGAVENPGYLVTLAGRKRHFTLPPSYMKKYYADVKSQLSRQAANYPMQAANADCIKFAFADSYLIYLYYHDEQEYKRLLSPELQELGYQLVEKYCPNYIGFRPLFPVHDEGLAQVKVEYGAEGLQCLQGILLARAEESVNYLVPMEVSGFINKSWGK